MGESERLKLGNTVSIIGICCNIFLSAAKMLIGLMTGMISVVADGVNNLSDAGASILSLIGFRLSSVPADDEHPFGHARYEYISGLAVSFLVMLAGVELFKSSIKKLIYPEKVNLSVLVFGILILSILVKIVMSTMYFTAAKKIDSSSIMAAAADSRNDCISTGAVLVASLITYFTGFNLDAYMGLAVSVFVIVSGLGLVKDTIQPLLGATPDEKLVKRIENKIMSYDGVLGTHDLMVHDYGPGHCFASVHVEVPAQRSVLECHEMIDLIEQDFMASEHIHLVIHYDPIVTDDSAVGELRAYLEASIKDIDQSLSIHDLRIVPGEENTNVIFDCLVPRSCKIEEAKIIDRIKLKLKESYPNHTAVIKIDHSYVSLN